MRMNAIAAASPQSPLYYIAQCEADVEGRE